MKRKEFASADDHRVLRSLRERALLNETSQERENPTSRRLLMKWTWNRYGGCFENPIDLDCATQTMSSTTYEKSAIDKISL